MKCVKVSIKRIEVDKFAVKEPVDLKVFFDDGKEKCLAYRTELANVQDDVKNILNKIINYEKTQNQVSSDDILDSFISVIVNNDEDISEKMKNFLGRIKDDKSKMKNYNSHSGYIETLNKMQKKMIEFNDDGSVKKADVVKNKRDF
jgi:hypothetical protein